MERFLTSLEDNILEIQNDWNRFQLEALYVKAINNILFTVIPAPILYANFITFIFAFNFNFYTKLTANHKLIMKCLHKQHVLEILSHLFVFVSS